MSSPRFVKLSSKRRTKLHVKRAAAEEIFGRMVRKPVFATVSVEMSAFLRVFKQSISFVNFFKSFVCVRIVWVFIGMVFERKLFKRQPDVGGASRLVNS